MMRTAILSWCLMSLGCAAIATPAYAGDADGCSHFSWDVSHELKVMKQAAAPVTAAAKPGPQAPVIRIDELYELKLSPQSGVTYSAKPAKPTLNDSAQGGLVRFHVDKAGLYRVSITSGHWIDIVDSGKLIRSRDFQGARGCERPRKIVEYELPGDKDLTLQLSGSPDASVVLSVTAVAGAPTG